MGSLWAFFLRELAVSLGIGEKVASRVSKDALLGVFWGSFGRLWGDISKDLGCTLNATFLGMS